MISFHFAMGLLFGFAAVVPVLIHFLHRKRIIEDVPSLLLFTGFRKTRRRPRLFDYLLLLLRILMLVLTGAILAMPFLRVSGETILPARMGNESLAVLFDDSALSMHTKNGTPYFELARAELKEYLKKLPRESRILFATSSAHAAAPPMTPEDASAFLDILSPLPVRGGFAAAADALASAVRRAGASRAAFLYAGINAKEVFTDLSGAKTPSGVWNRLAGSRLSAPPDPWIAGVDALPGGDFRIRFDGGGEGLSKFEFAAEDVFAREKKSFRPTPGEQTEKSMRIGDPFPGVKLLVFRLPSPKEKNSAPPFSVFYLSRVIGNAARNVLIPYDDSALSGQVFLFLYTVFDTLGNTALPMSVGAWNLHSETPDPAKYPAVVIPPLSEITPELRCVAGEILRNGGRVIVFPQNAPFLPDGFQPDRAAVWKSAVPVKNSSLSTPERKHEFAPYLAIANRGFDRASWTELRPLEILPDDTVVYSAGDIPLLTFRRGAQGGTLILFGTGFSPFPVSMMLNPLFPELMAQTAGFRTEFPDSSSFSRGGTALFPDEFSLPPSSGALRIVPPEGDSSGIPVPAGSRIGIDFESSGFYAVSDAGKKETISYFAVNDPRPGATPDDKSPGTEIRSVSDALFFAPADAVEGAEIPLSERDLTPVFAAALLFVFLLETCLSALPLRKRRAEA